MSSITVLIASMSYSAVSPFFPGIAQHKGVSSFFIGFCFAMCGISAAAAA